MSPRRTPRWAAASCAVALLASALAGCQSASARAHKGSGATGAGAAAGKPVVVLAAASLREAFTAAAAAYSREHGGVRVPLSFAGSQELVAQVQQGAPADVVATADTTSMARLRDRVVDPPVTFAHNALEIAVAPGNPQHVHGLRDLARRGLVTILAAPQVPAGRYAAAALRAAGVEVHPASLEENVRGVLTKVELGEADAGVVYVTDVRAAGRKVTGVPVTGGPVAAYPIAALTPAGRGFVRFVLSAEGQRILAAYGFLPP